MTTTWNEFSCQESQTNSLEPSDAIWRQWSWSTLAQVMACCLTAPSHYLNQCWLIISKVEWHSSKGEFTRDTSAINHWNYLENSGPKISFKFPGGRWVNVFVKWDGFHKWEPNGISHDPVFLEWRWHFEIRHPPCHRDSMQYVMPAEWLLPGKCCQTIYHSFSWYRWLSARLQYSTALAVEILHSCTKPLICLQR